jgi:hypothetical protein
VSRLACAVVCVVVCWSFGEEMPTTRSRGAVSCSKQSCDVEPSSTLLGVGRFVLGGCWREDLLVRGYLVAAAQVVGWLP